MGARCLTITYIEPSDNTLFSLFAEVLTVALKYVKKRRESNGYFGQHSEWPELEWNDNGMPLLTESLDAPIDYADALRPRILPLSLSSSQPRFEEEPSFAALLDYIRSDPRISVQLVAGFPGLLRSLLSVLVGEVLDRYIHVSGLFELEPRSLLPIYVPVETYLLNDKLSIALVVPILCLLFETEKVDLDDRTTIVKLSDDIHLARAPGFRYNYGADPRVQASATHGLVLTGYSVQNDNAVEIVHALARPDAYPLKAIDKFFAALRLVTGHSTGYAQLLAVPLDWAAHYKAKLTPLHATTVRYYPPQFEDGYWRETMPKITRSELEEVGEVFRGIKDLEDKRLSIALRRLNQSGLRSNVEDGLLDAMIGLEALLSDGNQEMTYKIAMRLAGLYKLAEPDKPIQAFQEIKKIYKLRSKVVHGEVYDIDETIERDGSRIRVVDAAVEHLRGALRALIEHSDYRDVQTLDRDLLIDAGAADLRDCRNRVESGESA